MTAEMASNMWRNRPTVAVFIIAASLTSLLFWQGAANASGAAESAKVVTVWMTPHATTHEIHSVRARLAQLSYVRQPCAYWNKARNFVEARKLLPTEVIKGATVKEMPTSFRCTPVASVDDDKVIRTMDSALGVLTVTVSPPNLDLGKGVQRH
jgi:hypothetical protein